MVAPPGGLPARAWLSERARPDSVLRRHAQVSGQSRRTTGARCELAGLAKAGRSRCLFALGVALRAAACARARFARLSRASRPMVDSAVLPPRRGAENKSLVCRQ